MGNKTDAQNCIVYKEIGCCHVDGYLCNMDTCSILEKYQFYEFAIEEGIKAADEGMVETLESVKEKWKNKNKGTM